MREGWYQFTETCDYCGATEEIEIPDEHSAFAPPLCPDCGKTMAGKRREEARMERSLNWVSKSLAWDRISSPEELWERIRIPKVLD